jgi:iron complex outermembrane receptor protein
MQRGLLGTWHARRKNDAQRSRTQFVVGVCLILAILPGAAFGQGSISSMVLPQIDVITTSPLGGAGVDPDKVSGSTQTLLADDFSRTYSPSITDTLMQRVPGVSTTDVQGNGFVQDLRYRGFAASPLQGTPQGLAVYMNGIRVNEAFGDTVNWDLIPTNAINRTDIWTNNPVFGLNALGGAVNIQMKNGFTYSGMEVETQGGSYVRAGGSAQFGIEKDGVGVYLSAQGVNDAGWRYQSPAQVGRFYGDVGWRGEAGEIHAIGAVARNYFGVVGPTPIQLLNQDNKAIYTWPQTTRNDMQLVALNGKVTAPESWTLQSNFYVRGFQQRHVDGNDADVERCSNASSFGGKLCLEDDGFPVPPGGRTQAFRNQFVVLDANNNPITFQANTPYGTVDRTSTNATTIGSSVQATNDAKLFGHGNYFSVGGSIDHSRVAFDANSELGYIFPDLSVGPNAGVPGAGSIIHTLANIGYGPVSLNARSTYYGLYVTDVFDITSRLSANAGARLNVAKIGMSDLLGTSPDLNGNYTFTRLNPMAGLSYKATDNVTAYGGYSQSNRAPTPLELGCANPSKPCLLEGFLVSDPPLKQVVAKTYEVGLRGKGALSDGRIEWKVALFRTDSSNDIINVASAIQGRGVFQNVAATRRQGAEAGAQYFADRWFAYANYSYINATYQFTGDIASPNNPSADANGNVHVTPGKFIPGIPQHQFKAGAEYAVTSQWKIGADVIVVGSQYFVGDQANQNEKLPAYWVTNIHTSYDLSKNVRIFGLVNNLFNRTYYPYGTYFDPQSVQNALPTALTDQRTLTPGQPFSAYVGLRILL